MKTRILYTKVWKDEYFAGLVEAEKLLFIYLITNERVNISGVYEITNREIMFDTQLIEVILKAIKKKFQDDGKFYFYENWVAIVNIAKYQIYTGSMNAVAGQKEIRQIPVEFRDILEKIPYQYPISTLSANDDTSINQKPETSNHNLENENRRYETRSGASNSLAIDRIRKQLADKKTLGGTPTE